METNVESWRSLLFRASVQSFWLLPKCQYAHAKQLVLDTVDLILNINHLKKNKTFSITGAGNEASTSFFCCCYFTDSFFKQRSY